MMKIYDIPNNTYVIKNCDTLPIEDLRAQWDELTIEEKQYFGTDEIWSEPVPDSEEMVLVSDGVTIWLDEWYSDTDGANLMDSDALGLYWMPLPELPKEVSNGKKHIRRC